MGRISAWFPVTVAVSSVDLDPLASVSISLFCGDEQLQVQGPVHISLPLRPGLRLQAADTIPAWAFNFSTGKKTHPPSAVAKLAWLAACANARAPPSLSPSPPSPACFS